MYKNYRWIFKNSVPGFGGDCSNGANAGAFYLDVTYSEASSEANIGGRLIFL